MHVCVHPSVSHSKMISNHYLHNHWWDFIHTHTAPSSWDPLELVCIWSCLSDFFTLFWALIGREGSDHYIYSNSSNFIHIHTVPSLGCSSELFSIWSCSSDLFTLFWALIRWGVYNHFPYNQLSNYTYIHTVASLATCLQPILIQWFYHSILAYDWSRGFRPWSL
jgi:hypothetical protein